ncbi:MAG TPA: glycosyltransferase family 4 protein [bacterium]|nr:glycosyltransferase family 4 protein [Candidatus Omnitrophota bacterium]HOJ60174.1 glycosyltransferase family 4 protein [bacterium]HOL96562.1 glycosyltransferase family 4 protein [bacterium]HPP02816.1 glycosyltransferase family 4 protein [bacterium]HXK94298.1 glycosyltransferase family 4 protein [bacterium]
MRIGYIGDGHSVHNHFMTDWFQRQGHAVLFLTDTSDPGLTCEVRVVAPRQGGGPFRHFLAAIRTRRWIQLWKPEIVHAHNVTGYGYWGALSGFSPLILTAWGSDLNILTRQRPVVRRIVRWCLRRAALITADAAALAATARELAGGQSDIRILQWGVDLAQFNNPVDEDFRQKYRGNAEWVFLSTRRLRPIYNIDVILRAYAQIVERFPNSRLVVVGDDEQGDTLQELAKNLGIAERVMFTGWLDRPDLIRMLLLSDVFISVPSSDSTALSLLEAFAARLPVIVSDLPANREWIEPGGNGLLVTPRDVDSLVWAMAEVAHNPSQARQWGEINRRIVEERGDQEKEMRKLEQWYRDLIQNKNSTIPATYGSC